MIKLSIIGKVSGVKINIQWMQTDYIIWCPNALEIRRDPTSNIVTNKENLEDVKSHHRKKRVTPASQDGNNIALDASLVAYCVCSIHI